ncbi:MAG: hypothetical protein ABSB22_11345 [Thermodesulfobacteriota bacterium]
MKLYRLNKAKLGILLITLSALLSNSFTFWKAIEQYRKSPNEDEITAYEKRFRMMKSILPPHGVVGYVADIADQQSAQWYMEYFLTQYVLSPVIVVNETSRHLVIGNFHGPINSYHVPYDAHLVTVREFDNGVILFKNKEVN